MNGDLRDSEESLPLPRQQRLIAICDRFENAWKAGHPPQLDDHLNECEPSEQPLLFRELLALDVHYRKKADQTPSSQEYLDRYPQHGDLIQEVFDQDDAGTQETLTIKLSDTSTHARSGQVTTEHPASIGRYRIDQVLGQGGFGQVYLARDNELDRHVAIKVPRADRVSTPEDVEFFLSEARVVASLDHPNIVPVHDVGQTEDGSCFVVSKFVEGSDLQKRITAGRPPYRESAELVATVAEALHHAHLQRIVHRDIKPANILLDTAGTPFVADFGLALREEDYGRGGDYAGTPAYMSPEQARGEAHLVDGRSDIFSLGTVFYELLTGALPFTGSSGREVATRISTVDARPPRQLDDSIPIELERICLKALAKRATDRYSTAKDFADDLRAALSESEVDRADDRPRPVRIIPKGLRSFDAADADFFLDLLPGPRDRDGLPESIRFWKHRTEATDADATFRVGLIYGPSGCGKSSLVKAGLLPRLSSNIVPVYVEASAVDTEMQLLYKLRKSCAALPSEIGLADAIAMLRRGEGLPTGKKVLIVLDQLEQWLHERQVEENTELVKALRHCDGEHVQCLVMVRDDFYLGVNRFFQQLEERLLEGHNQALVDLFDPDHAKKVLTAFGRAYGKLPETELTHEQMEFLDAAVTGLAAEGKVVSVRLAVFAEMIKSKPWTRASLRDVGGTEGVGVTFLEETFAARTAPPNYRLHEKGIRAVLNALLPELGTDIKGQMQPHQQLLRVSEYEGRPADFDALLDILNTEVRLVTPAESDDTGGEIGARTERSAKHYQLTHDYLVPSLRRWLRQKQTESYTGRARLRLAERAALWQRKPQNQQLPTSWEYLNILALTRKRDWTATGRRMMSAARWYYATRAMALAVLVALSAWGGREMVARINSSALVNNLANAGEDKVLETVADLQPYMPWVRERLQDLARREPNTPDESRQLLHARLALIGTDGTQVSALLQSLLTASPGYVGVIRDALRPYQEKIAEDLWQECHGGNSSVDRRFRAGMALADYVPGSQKWKDDDFRFLAEQLLLENPKDQPAWLGYVRPLSDRCVPHWERLFSETGSSETELLGAANALAEFAGKDQRRIAGLLAVANPKQYAILFPLIGESPDDVAKSSLAEIAATSPADDLSSADRVPFGQRRAGAGITLLRLGERESVLPTFEMTDDPEALTQFIHRCKDRGVSAEELLECLRLASSSSPTRQASSPARYALLLALAEYSLSEIPEGERDQLLTDLSRWYEHDPSSGVHGATGWLLGQWGQDEIVQKVDQTPVPYSPDREWFTLVVTAKSPRRVYPSEAAEDGDEATEKEEATRSPDGKPAESAEGSTNKASGKDEDTTSSDKPSANSEEHGEDSSAGDTEKADDSEEASKEADQTEREPDFVPQAFYFTFIVVPAGEYQIGSRTDEPERTQLEVPHLVRITRPFALLDRELAFAELIAFDRQYEGYMQEFGRNPVDAAFGPDWYDAVAFCRWLTEQAGFSEEDQSYPAPDSLDEKEFLRELNPEASWAPHNWPVRLDRRGIRLPSEAEWEVACRMGTRTMYGQGGDISLLRHHAWFVENSGKHVHPPKTRRPALRGLFDMHGNVHEWCHDWYGGYVSEAVVDETGPETVARRVGRGGSWRYDAAYCRSSSRSSNDPTDRYYDLGFRVALVPSRKDAGGGEEERAKVVDPSQAEPDGS